MAPVGSGTAFVAGFISFLSPCVLPLVPGYISFVSGLSFQELTNDSSMKTKQAGLAAIFFVLGFSVFFITLGASASALGQTLQAHMKILSRIAGVIIILFGLHLTGILPIRWLYYEKRFSSRSVPPSFGGAFLMGLAFACGWTPCIGPILSAILALAAVQKTVTHGIYLLAFYSLGLGIPFIAAGFSIPLFLKFFARYKRYIHIGEIASGVLLIGIGFLIFTRRLTWLTGFLPQSFFRFAL